MANGNGNDNAARRNENDNSWSSVPCMKITCRS